MVLPLADLWWLPEEAVGQDLLIELAHKDARSEIFEIANDLYGIQTVRLWREKFEDNNVFRSVLLFLHDHSSPAYRGPFYIDVDSNEERLDLDDAARVTSLVVRTLLGWGVSRADLRVLFTGHKGFNVEVRPEAVALSSDYHHRSHADWNEVRHRIIDEVKRRTDFEHPQLRNVVSPADAVIDTIKGHLRFVGSANAWIDDSGVLQCRRKSKVPIDDFLADSAGNSGLGAH